MCSLFCCYACSLCVVGGFLYVECVRFHILHSHFTHISPFSLNHIDETEDSSNAYRKPSSSSSLDPNSHLPMGHINDDGPQPLEQAMLRKYIAYARANVKPILHDLDTEKVCIGD